MPLAALSPANVAVVTGGASGIGLAAARSFAGMGIKVCIADLGEDRLSGGRSVALAQAAAARSWPCPTDVRDAGAEMRGSSRRPRPLRGACMCS